MESRGARLVLLLLALSGVGCQPGDGTDDEASGIGPAGPVPAGVHEYGERRFDVRVAFTPGRSPERGGPGPGPEQGRLHVRVTPGEAWHFSEDFPTVLELHGESVGLERVQHTRRDAQRHTAEHIEFEVGCSTSDRADAQVAGAIEFAVCRGPLCERVRHAFALEVPPG